MEDFLKQIRELNCRKCQIRETLLNLKETLENKQNLNERIYEIIRKLEANIFELQALLQQKSTTYSGIKIILKLLQMVFKKDAEKPFMRVKS